MEEDGFEGTVDDSLDDGDGKENPSIACADIAGAPTLRVSFLSSETWRTIGWTMLVVAASCQGSLVFLSRDSYVACVVIRFRDPSLRAG